jgi:hypothetical protein
MLMNKTKGALVGAGIGVGLVLLIVMARRILEWIDPEGGPEGGTFLAFVAVKWLGAPLNLAVAVTAEPLREFVARVLQRRVSYLHVFYAGLIINWTLLGFLFGVWRDRRWRRTDV